MASTRRPWVTTLRIAQPGELCATKQSPSSKIRESKLWHKRGLNLAATSALGYVTVALASAVPELDSTPINKLTDDMRSFVFDGAVRSVPSVCPSVTALSRDIRFHHFQRSYAMAAILDAILNFTHFVRDPDCPPKFFYLPWGVLTGSRVKISGHHCTQSTVGTGHTRNAFK